MTIAKALRYARERLAGGDSPRADAEILLAHVLGRSRSYLVAWPEQPLVPEAWAAFQRLVARRAEGMPVAYLTGKRAFFGLELAVTDAVLIPRPETELLVEAALERLPHGPCTLADRGTGSGAI
ncbi:MAG: HemK/PrmC family methyltransferase, partial [Gammaproteobacteria bacterium]|nr:HemK/PrmC family methyltransferase [Gammaproteobacteria bacterium]